MVHFCILWTIAIALISTSNLYTIHLAFRVRTPGNDVIPSTCLVDAHARRQSPEIDKSRPCGLNGKHKYITHAHATKSLANRDQRTCRSWNCARTCVYASWWFRFSLLVLGDLRRSAPTILRVPNKNDVQTRVFVLFIWTCLCVQ